MWVGGLHHAPAVLPQVRRPGTPCVGGWMGPIAGLDEYGNPPPPPSRPTVFFTCELKYGSLLWRCVDRQSSPRTSSFFRLPRGLPGSLAVTQDRQTDTVQSCVWCSLKGFCQAIVFPISEAFFFPNSRRDVENYNEKLKAAGSPTSDPRIHIRCFAAAPATPLT
jgi:hypothetical protein